MSTDEVWRGSIDQVKFSIPEPVFVTIIQQPNSLSAPIGSTAALSVAVTGSNPTYQCYKDADTPGDPATAILGISNPTLSFTPFETTDAGDYQVIISNGISTKISIIAAITVVPDTTITEIVTVNANSPATNVIVIFSEPIRSGSARNTSNYQFSNESESINVLTADLYTDNRTVILTTSALQDGVQYTLRVSGI